MRSVFCPVYQMRVCIIQACVEAGGNFEQTKSSNIIAACPLFCSDILLLLSRATHFQLRSLAAKTK
jgi:hypothetical protein